MTSNLNFVPFAITVFMQVQKVKMLIDVWVYCIVAFVCMQLWQLYHSIYPVRYAIQIVRLH
jgi:hypothetical protein